MPTDRVEQDVAPRKHVDDLVRVANETNRKAFITLEETRVDQQNTPPAIAPFGRRGLLRAVRPRA